LKFNNGGRDGCLFGAYENASTEKSSTGGGISKYGKIKYDCARVENATTENEVKCWRKHPQMAQPSMDRAAKQTLQNTQKYVNLRNNFKVGPTDWVGWVRVQQYYTSMGLRVGINVANSTITEVTAKP